MEKELPKDKITDICDHGEWDEWINRLREAADELEKSVMEYQERPVYADVLAEAAYETNMYVKARAYREARGTE